MELPAGWKRLKYGNPSAYYFPDVLKDQAADLMKEMAEALEKYERQSDDGRPGYIPPQCEVLKKFKEWK